MHFDFLKLDFRMITGFILWYMPALLLVLGLNHLPTTVLFSILQAGQLPEGNNPVLRTVI